MEEFNHPLAICARARVWPRGELDPEGQSPIGTRSLLTRASLMWNDRVKSNCTFCSPSLLAGAADEATVEAACATVDQTDVRGSEPHGRDPSGAISD